MQNVLWHIYIDDESKTLRGDPTRRAGKAKAVAAANLLATAIAADPSNIGWFDVLI